MKLKQKLGAATAIALLVVTGALANDSITVMSWGGAYSNSQVEAYHKPFTKETGIQVQSVDADNPATAVKAQVEARNVTIDVADVEYSDAVRFCDEGLIEPIDHSMLPDAPDGTPVERDFIEGALPECAVGNIVYSMVVAYNTDKVDGKPKTVADFFDLDTFPGKRGLKRSPKATLELALMATGMPADQVYQALASDYNVDQAFAMLDSIKDEIVWWEAGAQPPQLLADGEVVMSTAFNGRIFNAVVGENQPFEIMWDGQILDFDLFVIPKGAPNKEKAMEFIKFATGTKPLADQASWISYGPTRRSSAALVGLYKDGVTDMAPHMPTAPQNLSNALVNDFEFWADRDVELNERFNAWLSN